MPNGFHGSIEEWQQMEAPFLEIDDALEKFAADRKMQVVKNYHNWPRRELEWVGDDIHRSISIFQGERPDTFHMAVGAWQDKQSDRYAANKWLKKEVLWPEITDNLQELLEEAVAILDAWSEKDLKWSTTLSPNVWRS